MNNMKDGVKHSQSKGFGGRKCFHWKYSQLTYTSKMFMIYNERSKVDNPFYEY